MKLEHALSNLAKVAAVALALTVLGFLVVNAHRAANPESPPDAAARTGQPPPDPGPPGSGLAPGFVTAEPATTPARPFLFSSKFAPIIDTNGTGVPGPVQAPQPVFLPSSKIGLPGIQPRLAPQNTGAKIEPAASRGSGG